MAVDRFSTDSGAPTPDAEILRDVGRSWRRERNRTFAIVTAVTVVFFLLMALLVEAPFLPPQQVSGTTLALFSPAAAALIVAGYLAIESVAKLAIGGPASFGSTSRAQLVTEATVDEVREALRPALSQLSIPAAGPEPTTVRYQPLSPGRAAGLWYLYVDVRPSADQPGKTVVTWQATPSQHRYPSTLGAPQQVINQMLALVPMTSQLTRPALPPPDLQPPLIWLTTPQPEASYVQPPEQDLQS